MNKILKPVMSNQLHLVENSVNIEVFIKQLNRYCQNGDTILFLNDSIYSLMTTEFNNESFFKLTKQLTLLVLKEHCEARALKELPKSIRNIQYQEFANLSINSTKVISW